MLQADRQTDANERFKPGFHYPSWRPELTVTRQRGPLTRVVETGLYSRDCMSNYYLGRDQ